MRIRSSGDQAFYRDAPEGSEIQVLDAEETRFQHCVRFPGELLRDSVVGDIHLDSILMIANPRVFRRDHLPSNIIMEDCQLRLNNLICTPTA